MVKIRLQRAGAKKRPFYKIVAIDERSARDSRALEFLGTYDPKCDPAAVKLDLAGVDRWLGRGARLSETVASLVNRVRRNGAAAPTPEAS